MKYYTNEQLQTFNIYELRCIAREKGVRSPTTKKRQELLDSILAIQDGELEPRGNVVSKGRPAKPFNFENRNSESVFFNPPSDFTPLSHLLNFRSREMCVFDDVGKVFETSGFFAQSQQGYCFLNFENPCGAEIIAYINFAMAKELGLKFGDYCLIFAKRIADSELPVVDSVIAIYSQLPANFSRISFEFLQPMFCNEKIEFVDEESSEVFKKQQLCYGERVLVVGNKDTLCQNILAPMSKSLKNGLKVVMILVGQTPEIVNFYQHNFKGMVFFSLYTDAYTKQKYLFDLALNYCKGEVAMGEKVIVFVNGLNQLVEMEQNNHNGTQDKMFEIKQLYSFARHTSNSGALTVVGVADRRNEDIIQSLSPNMNHILDETSFVCTQNAEEN